MVFLNFSLFYSLDFNNYVHSYFYSENLASIGCIVPLFWHESHCLFLEIVRNTLSYDVVFKTVWHFIYTFQRTFILKVRQYHYFKNEQNF